MDVEPYIKDGSLTLIDYYSMKMGTHPTCEEHGIGIVKLKSLDPTEFSILIGELTIKPIDFVYVDSLYDIFITYGYKHAVRLLNMLIPRIRETCIGAFALDEGILKKRLENYLRSVFDGILEYKIVERPEGIERYVRVAHFDLARIDSRWHKLVIGPRELTIE